MSKKSHSSENFFPAQLLIQRGAILGLISLEKFFSQPLHLHLSIVRLMAQGEAKLKIIRMILKHQLEPYHRQFCMQEGAHSLARLWVFYLPSPLP